MQHHNDIKAAAKLIQEGKLVAFPTETVYGLGANALDPLAVAKIFEMKERPSFDPLIVHIADLSDLDKLTIEKDPRVDKLAENFWPGPLTIVLPKSNLVPDLVTSGLPTVGIRMPDSEIALELIRLAKCPIAAPSANKFGRISPTTAAHVKKQLPTVDCILDGGKTKVGIESTIISLNKDGFELLRKGIITREEIEKVIPYTAEISCDEKISAPGMLKSHYSPIKDMFITDHLEELNIDKSKAGLISFTGKFVEGYQKVIFVSKEQDLKEYAINLFAAMHTLEETEVEYIVAEAVLDHGIGGAIMDRLRKASFKIKH